MAEPFGGRLHVSGDHESGDNSARGPVCPHCREPLRGNVRQEQVVPPGGLAVTVTYCGACGWTLDCAPARVGGAAGYGLVVREEVAAPADEHTLEGQFQLTCRELIGEVRSLGFEPNVWVAMTNSLGAAGAARRLLAEHRQLAVTPWLVRRGRPELTLEHAIRQPRWAELFTEAERAEAARRLAQAGKPRRRRRWPRRQEILPTRSLDR